MGWWEQSSSRWDICVVAQMGGAVAVGAGVFFIQFRSVDLPVRPIYVAIAGGFGVGGSIGSAVSIPYRSVIKQLMTGKSEGTGDIGWSPLKGTFSAENVNHSKLNIAQAGASAIIIGGQFVNLQCWDVNLFTPDKMLFESRYQWPKNLREVADAALDIPQIQGGLGAGAFAFSGIMQYIGT